MDDSISLEADDRVSVLTYHVFVAVGAPYARVSEPFLLDGSLGSLAAVRDGDGSLNSPVQHVHWGAYRDVIAAMQDIITNLLNLK